MSKLACLQFHFMNGDTVEEHWPEERKAVAHEIFEGIHDAQFEGSVSLIGADGVRKLINLSQVRRVELRELDAIGD